MEGELVMCTRSEWIIKKDSVFAFLVKPNSYVDSDVATLLSVILPAMKSLSEDHYKELLNENPS